MPESTLRRGDAPDQVIRSLDKERQRVVHRAASVDRATKVVRYKTYAGKASREGTVTRRGAQCIVCNEPVTLAYSVRKERRIGLARK